MAAFCLAVAAILRFASLGDPNLYDDEVFYFYVGQQMHHGALPYVDIWDRKPLGLFILFWAFAGISTSVLSYQIAALISAAATAFLITRIVKLWGGPAAQALAALAYLSLLHPLNGHGGQSPVFYNTLIAAAALLTLHSRSGLSEGRVPQGAYWAMALCGLALTIKQTTLFEGVLFALWMLVLLARSQSGVRILLWTALRFAALGAAPTLMIALWYVWIGHGAEFWFAMVTSNTVRPPIPLAAAVNIPTVLQIVGLTLCAALAALILAGRMSAAFAQNRWFVAGWIIAAVAGFASVGSFLDHHALSLAVPLCVAASAVFAKGRVGPVLAVTIAASAMAQSNPFAFEVHRRSAYDFTRAEQMIASNGPRSSVFVYEGPLLLYATPGVRRLTRLVFPMHFNSISELGTSFYPQIGEVDRILAQKPQAVVWMVDGSVPMDPQIEGRLRAYVFSHCQRSIVTHRWQMRASVVPTTIYAGCR